MLHPPSIDETIVAVATPPGRGGIGVVRIAGPESWSIARSLLRIKAAHLEPELFAGRARFAELIEPATGDRIDEVVVTAFQKPNSYTTDDVIEIAAHGSPVVLRHIVEMAIARGARLAEPGEFTMRAFLNGRIDLTQAEAVRDLIESQTLFQAKVAAQQLDGSLSKRIEPIKAQLLELIALLEAGIDFADDDVAIAPWPEIEQRIKTVRQPLEELEKSFTYGRMVHEGLTLAIVGRPNVGKSSLFNRLLEAERAIVTDTPGTTRDTVSETVAIGGIPVRLVDTAGIREAHDAVEKIGIDRSRQAMADADVVLLVLDATEQLTAEDERLMNALAARRTIMVINKIDAVKDFTGPEGMAAVSTSALTGVGITELRAKILIEAGAGEQHESGFLTNVRHQSLVRDALAALEEAAQSAKDRVPHEMLMLNLYNTLQPIDAITGATTTEDILGMIFGKFCIGK